MMCLEDLFGVSEAHASPREGSSKTLTSGCGPCTYFALCRHFRIDFSGQGSIPEFVTCALLLAPELILLGETGFGQAHQLIQDCEFKFQLDCIDHGFNCGFADVIIREFETNEDNIHTDAYAIDCQKLYHHFPGHAVVDRAQKPDCGCNVDGRDDEFLDAEANELNSFHYVEFGRPELCIWRITAICEDDCRKMKCNCIENYHRENVAQSLLISDDEMKARI